MEDQTINIFWFRRDLRLTDNHGLFRALTSSGRPVLPVFVFDTCILNNLEDDDSRVTFILRQVQRLHDQFEKAGSSFWIYHGQPIDAFKRLHTEYRIDTVFFNQDYEPYALARDRLVAAFLGTVGIRHQACRDHVIFHQNEILNESGKPYVVFTPYSRKWKSLFTPGCLSGFPSERHLFNLLQMSPLRKYHHPDIGFRPGAFTAPLLNLEPAVLSRYEEKRDYPGEDATTRLGVHLRFGTVSIRKVTAMAADSSPALFNELIWRNFYIDLLWHFPHVARGAFNRPFDRINWINSEKDFARWCEGTTGFPMVDAGMRQLNATGFMHNRARMIVAGFLCKHLLIDWKWGEAYFAEKLLDYELASNNGGWQWAAGSGCDAAPYFRVFNPELQQKKFDPDLTYIRRWIPEFGTDQYPKPMVAHPAARLRAIQVYREALSEK